MFINVLKNDGIFKFCFTEEFLNCSYYDKTRKLINKKLSNIGYYTM